MNPISVDIKDMLVNETSLNLTFATNLFIGMEPSQPDSCVTIYDTGGGPYQLTFDNTPYYVNSFQVRVRDNSYLDGWARIHNIMTTLHGRGHVTINGALYELITCESGPSFLQRDEIDRMYFIANFETQRKEA